MEYFGAVADGFAKARRPHRDDHELLDVEVVVRVGTAVDHVHHRHRHRHRGRAAEVAVERQARLFGRGLRDRHRDGEHRVRAQARLVLGAVEIDQRAIEEGLLVRVEPHYGLGNFGVDVLAGFQHTFAAIAMTVAGGWPRVGVVPQLDRFARAGRCARGHRSAPEHAGLEQHVALHRRIAPAVDDLAADDVNDCTHVFPVSGFEFFRAGFAYSRQAPSTMSMFITAACSRAARPLR